MSSKNQEKKKAADQDTTAEKYTKEIQKAIILGEGTLNHLRERDGDSGERLNDPEDFFDNFRWAVKNLSPKEAKIVKKILDAQKSKGNIHVKTGKARLLEILDIKISGQAEPNKPKQKKRKNNQKNSTYTPM